MVAERKRIQDNETAIDYFRNNIACVGRDWYFRTGIAHNAVSATHRVSLRTQFRKITILVAQP